ncbi:DUF4380 domain-containing protein [Galbibacter mesophilus]|uniref:DUF4380 domain-containing protein n=1 Tax=Galbibacter mesophilus TaxID=379069 RepID=UPI00191DD977|nr:DUF4380 domain-containing protein [Galbibacter mesophilus]MCM5662732.1 DUF4380 domain-containing protein [Galbibacter mesophilus]
MKKPIKRVSSIITQNIQKKLLYTFFVGLTATFSYCQTNENVYQVTNKNVKIKIDANTGARITSLTYDGNEILKQAADSLPNFGSTLWPAPQNEWGWPPYYSLHKGAYKVEKSKANYAFESEVDTTSSLQMIKKFEKGDSKNALKLAYELINKGKETVKNGPWEVTVVPYGGMSFFRKETDPLSRSSLSAKETLGITYVIHDERYQGKQKLFGFTKGGWLAHVNASGLLFIKKMKDLTPSQIAPNHGEIEIFMNTELQYIELENHGKYSTLATNEKVDYDVTWIVLPLPKEIPSNKISTELIDFVEKTVSH